jgi:mannose-6-phosphate isomerase-like protein (cupin superfamily)
VEADDLMRYATARLDAIDPVRCPCGFTRRAFADAAGGRATAHLVDIEADSRVHYHRRLTEVYVVLEGEGTLELDGDRIPAGPMTAALILPGCRHRAAGELRVLVVAVPAFDPEDEWFD